MRVRSVNVGLPQPMHYKSRTIETSIVKTPVDGRVAVGWTNLEGDRQADLTVHGGPNKAVYVYPIEHYPYWEEFLGRKLPAGFLGENLTVEGLDEKACIGDRLRIGSAEFTVVQPRQPCYKFAAVCGRDDVVKAMLVTGYSGLYLSVAKEGELGAGDPIEVVDRDPHQIRVADLNALFRGEPMSVEFLERAIQVEAMTPAWREALQESLADA